MNLQPRYSRTAFKPLVPGISLAGSRLFIRLTQTPEEISSQASLYLQIISLGLIFTFFYNIFSAALRAIGDSRAPLYVLILTTVVNVFLDVFLVGICRLGVPGAAIATIISQAVSALALFVYIWAKVPLLRLGIRDLKLKTSMLKKTIDFSSISAVQQTILYVGRLLVQSGVNALGVDAVAAFNAVSIIDSYVLAPGDSLAASITTFSAQNLGAKEYNRIPKGLRKMLVIAEIYIILTAVVVLFCRHPLLGIFLKPNETEALGVKAYLSGADGWFLLHQWYHQYFSGILPGNRAPDDHSTSDSGVDSDPHCRIGLCAVWTSGDSGCSDWYDDWMGLYGDI